jgi:TRAP transporter TAXI family solute receptor
MQLVKGRFATRASGGLLGALVELAAFTITAGTASAQTYGFATLPPGTLNHTTASAISKVLKERAGMNVLVQPTAGDNVIIPMVGRGEAEIGIANAPEIAAAHGGGRQRELRLIGTAHPLRTAFWVRKDAPMRTIADLKGKRVASGYSAMRTIDLLTRAMLATGGLTEKDVNPVLVPNVIRSADDFVSGAADMFFFAFGAPKVREVDATVGGIRVLEIAESGMDAARKISPYGYLLDAAPGPVFVGVEKPMKVYSFDNVLITHAKVPDEIIIKIIDTLEKNKPDLVAVQPVLREFSAAGLYKTYDIPYHPGALKYFKDNKIDAKKML